MDNLSCAPRILIAPNAFKGSLSVLEAAKALARGACLALPEAQTILLPISDGGDGLMDALLYSCGGRRAKTWVKGPLGNRRRSEFAILKDGTAVVEMARASGLALISAAQRNPLRTTSWGTGDLIAAALRRGAKTIVVGMGGSASSDGGAGMAQALGARLLDKDGRELKSGAQNLLNLHRVEAAGLWRQLKGKRIIAVSDVTTPLTGPKGSARIFGPQKGATPSMVHILEKALERYASIIKRDLGISVAKLAGAGAAGGLGAGLHAFLKADIVPGAQWVLERVGARHIFSQTDVLLTGEGRLDSTSFYGKAPFELSRLARNADVPAAFVCAQLEKSILPKLRSAGIGAVVTFAQAGAKKSDSMAKAKMWAAQAARMAVTQLLLTSALLVLVPWARSAQQPDIANIDRLYFHRDQKDNLAQSQSKIEEILAINPQDSELLWREGRGLIRMGEDLKVKKHKLAAFEKAVDVLRQSTALNPKSADAHFWLGVAMGRLGETRGILKSLFMVGPLRREMQAVLSLDPNYGGAHRVLGEMYLQLPGFAGGDQEKGLSELKAAVKLSPTHTDNYLALADALTAQGDKTQAIAVIQAMLAVKDPADPAEYAGNIKEAREKLKKLEAP